MVHMHLTVPHHQQGPAVSSWALHFVQDKLREGSHCRSIQTLRGVYTERSACAQGDTVWLFNLSRTFLQNWTLPYVPIWPGP